MRTIKFRVFIRNMFGGFMIPSIDSDYFMVSNGNGFNVYDEHKNKLKDNEFEVMQFTGLIDKNGKEIYEGDIVKCSYFKMSVGANLGAIEVDAELIGTMTIQDLSLVVENIKGEKWSHYTGYAEGEGDCEIAYLHDVYEGSTDAEMSITVIGNIHENPELLK